MSGFFCSLSSLCFAQVDIYQSDAYSVEEMCAREAEQNADQDYSEAYDMCISNNRDKPMYQPDSADSTEIEETVQEPTADDSAQEQTI